jgi:hypothetical protein
MGGPPPGLTVDSIENLNRISKTTITVADIVNVKNGTIVNNDVVNFIQHLEQTDKDSVRRAEKALEEIQREFQAEKAKFEAREAEFQRLSDILKRSNEDNKAKLDNIISLNTTLETEIKNITAIFQDTMKKRDESLKAITDFLSSHKGSTDAEIKQTLDKLENMLVGNGDIRATDKNLHSTEKDRSRIAELEQSEIDKNAEIFRLQTKNTQLQGEKAALERAGVKFEGDLKELMESMEVLCNTEDFSRHYTELVKTLDPATLQNIPAELKKFLETLYPFVYCCSAIFSDWKKTENQIKTKKFNLTTFEQSYTTLIRHRIVQNSSFFHDIYFWVIHVANESNLNEIKTKYERLDISFDIALQMKSKDPSDVQTSNIFFEIVNTTQKFQGTVKQFEEKYNGLRQWLVESAYNQLTADLHCILKDKAAYSSFLSNIDFLKSKVMRFEAKDQIDDDIMNFWDRRLQLDDPDFPWLLWQHGFSSMSDTNELKDSIKVLLTNARLKGIEDLFDKIDRLVIVLEPEKYVDVVEQNTVLEYLQDENFI